VKQAQSIGMVLSAITGLLVLMLVSNFAFSANVAFARQRHAQHILSVVTMSRDIFLADDSLRIEQGVMSTALMAPEAASPQTLTHIAGLHHKAEAGLGVIGVPLTSAQIYRRVSDPDILRKTRRVYEKMFAAALTDLRLPAARRPAHASVDWSKAVGRLVAATDTQTSMMTGEIAGIDPLIDEMTKIGGIAWSIRKPAGIDRRLLANAIDSREILDSPDRQQFAELTGQIDGPWSAIVRDAQLPSFPPALKAAVETAQKAYFTDLRAKRAELIEQLAQGRSPSLSGQAWLQLSNDGLDSISAIPKTVFELTKVHAEEVASAASLNFYVSLASILLSLSIAAFAAWYLWRQVIKPLELITRTMQTVIEGNLKCPIPLQDRQDEIGQFARTLSLFRDGALERQRLETELIKTLSARETAEASSRVKSQFLANMSHELRTPLNAIIGFSALMKEQLHGPLSAQYDEYAGFIHESGHHLLNLISDILDVAKIEAGKFALDLQTVDFAETAAYCIQVHRGRAEARGVRLTADIPEQRPAMVADPRALKQILLNLLSNAVKFTRQGGEVTMTVRFAAERARIVVSDNGIGIPAEALSRIGRAFEQASNDPACAREGTGLGLALVSALVARHGGSLKIDSVENKGTTVTVELPLSQAERSEAA
jgi:signal transduction histidine kinase